MRIKDRINSDLKSAMLDRDKVLATTLRGLKSVILYAEVTNNCREAGLDDKDTIALLQKELKKRIDSIKLYKKAGQNDRAIAEEAESIVIERYLPERLSESEISNLVKDVADRDGISDISQMGQLITLVMRKANGRTDGATVARLVKEYLQL
ncbi:GatB/YqeY domain-containing protein [Candidatus Saccharibacteria bacterium]|nr:GatB/YqeY domain-containing protein [Candidatus Saccharibacteria bacterium]